RRISSRIGLSMALNLSIPLGNNEPLSNSSSGGTPSPSFSRKGFISPRLPEEPPRALEQVQQEVWDARTPGGRCPPRRAGGTALSCRLSKLGQQAGAHHQKSHHRAEEGPEGDPPDG